MGLMSRFEIRPGHYAPKHTRNGAIVLTLLLAGLYFGYSGGKVPLPKGGEVVTAEFMSAANVQPGKTPVRVRGIKVGEVEKVERRPSGRGVVVTMRVDDPGVHLRRDARAHIYWRTLLGFAFYVQLEQGSAPQELGDATIPLTRTTTQVELDQVLAALKPTSRAGLQTLLREFDKGFNRDSAAGRALDVLGPSMRTIAPGVSALRGTSQGDLTNTVREASRLMGTLASKELALGQLVDNAATTLGVTAARRADLGSILRNGPATLDDTRETMARLRTTLAALDPVAERLRPGARALSPAATSLRPALRELRPVLDDAKPLLRTLRPALRHLGRAGRSGTPLLAGLRPTLERLNDKIIPSLKSKDPELKLPTYQMIGPTFATVSSSAALFDAYGHTQRFQPLAGSQRSLAFLPCNANEFNFDLSTANLDCSDLQKVFGPLFGVRGARR